MSIRQTSVQPALQATNHAARGFILPSLVVFSIVLMSIGMIALQYITASTGSVQSSHFTSVAKSAADAGLKQALSCLEAGDYAWFTNNTTMQPNTNCDGVVNPNLSPTVSEATNGSWRSSFTVRDAEETSDGMTITSIGRVEFFYAGSSTPSNTYEASSKVSIPATNINETRPIAQGTAVTKVTAGDDFTCAIANMQVYCSGTQQDGRMATGTSVNANYLNPTLINTGGLAGGKRVTDLKSGYISACAITDGDHFCWGRGNMGQTGDNNGADYKVPTKPVPVPGYTGYVQKASSSTSATIASQYSCFLNQLRIYCTGANDYAQLGRPVSDRICILWVCGDWYLKTEPFYTSGFPANVNAGTPVPQRVFGTDVANESSNFSSLTNQSQLFNERPVDLDAGAYTACTLTNAKVFCWGDRFVSAPGTGDNGNTTASSGWRNTGVMAGKRATAMDIGESTSCLVSNGELYCWGQHPGNGTQKTPATVIPGWDTMSVSKATNTPGSALYDVNVEGLSLMSDDVYCAYGDGDGYCWGNYTLSSRTPIRFTVNNGDFAITDAAAGHYHACFAANGSQYCGGASNTRGELGSGDTTGHAYATTNFTRQSTVIGLSQGEAATDISSGQNHSCGIANGYIYCWGRNNRGQLGVGDIVDRNQPYGIINVSKPKAASQVSAGYDHSCGVISGTAYCWGDNTYGQLGNNTSGNYSDEPVAVQGLGSRKVTSIDAGRYHTCAVADAQAFCWGRNNYGQIGIVSPTTNQTTAQPVQGLGSDVPTRITTGDEFTCALANAYAYCWGRNNYGQIGQGSTATSSYNTAQRVPFELHNGWTQIEAGGEFVCGALNDVAKCWGRNDLGQLGRNNTASGTPSYSPANVVSSVSGQTVSWKQSSDISAGANHACAIANGDAYCWGANASGQLGIGSASASVTDSRMINKVAGYLNTNHAYRISAGGDHTCIIANAKISCWGAGGFGQLGDTTNTSTRTTASGWTGSFIRQQRTVDLPNARFF